MAHGPQEHLGLTPHPEQTPLTHGNDRFRILGDALRGQRLSLPPEPERAVKAKVKRVCGATQIPALDRCMHVNALLRGGTNDFRDARNTTHRLLSLTGLVYWLTAHDRGRKHRRSIQRMLRTRYGVAPASGERALSMTGRNGKRVDRWKKPPPWSALLNGGGGLRRCSRY
jgi:hypothetical protein